MLDGLESHHHAHIFATVIGEVRPLRSVKGLGS